MNCAQDLGEFRRTDLTALGRSKTRAVKSLVKNAAVVAFKPEHLDAVTALIDEDEERSAFGVAAKDLARCP